MKRFFSLLLSGILLLSAILPVARAVDDTGIVTIPTATDTQPESAEHHLPTIPLDPGSALLPSQTSYDAVRSNMMISLDTQMVEPAGYAIEGYTYYKLRDIAYLMQDKSCMFSVGWEQASYSVTMQTGEPYTATGEELKKESVEKTTAKIGDCNLLLNGTPITLEGYLIHENNYFKLRDIGEALGFGVDYDAATRTILIDTQQDPEKGQPPESDTEQQPEAPVVQPEQPPEQIPEIEQPGQGEGDPEGSESTGKPVPEPEQPSKPNELPENTESDEQPEQLPIPEIPPEINPEPEKDEDSENVLEELQPIPIPDPSDEWFVEEDENAATDPEGEGSEDDPEAIGNPRVDGILRIVLDAGHGGSDSGTVGKASVAFEGPLGEIEAGASVYEKDFNLAVALRLQHLLEREDVEVVMIREDDTTVSSNARSKLLKEYGETADLILSVHHNAANGKAAGAELLAQIRYENGGAGAEFAEIYKEAIEDIGHTMRKTVYKKNDKGNDYYFVLRAATSVDCLAFISEFCFLDNPTDQQWVFGEDALDTEAILLFDVIMEYYQDHPY